MKDEGFLSPAGRRFVILAAILILGGVLAYFALSGEISIDLDELTQTSTTDVSVPDVTIPEPPEAPDDPISRCFEDAQTTQEILDCTNR